MFKRVSTLFIAAICVSSMANGAPAQDKAVEPKKVSIPYAKAHDKPLDVKEEVVDEADTHTRYRVEFNGIKDDRVPAYLYVPKKKEFAGKNPFPAVLLQYGSGGNKKTDYIVAIGKQFVARGYVVLTIDSPNQGERRGKDPKTAGGLGMLSSEQVMHYCGDYCRAVDYLETRKDVDKDRLGFVGISFGAITGVTYVAYDPRIKAMGSMVGGGNFLGLYSKQLAEKVAAEGSKSSDPVFHVARIAPRPLLFINVTKDQLILKSWAESLHKAAGPGSKVVWLETDHYFKDVDRAQVCESVIDFMDKEVANKASQKNGAADLVKAIQTSANAENCAFSIQQNGPGAAVDVKYQKGQPLHAVADKIEFYRKDDILVYKHGEEWLRTRTGTLSDPLRILGASAQVRAIKLPKDELTLLAKSVANAKKSGKEWTLDLDADVARDLARTEDRDLAKSATAKFWLDADGRLAKYEIAIRIQGRRGNAEVDGVVTKTVTLIGLGTTKVDVPAAALSAFEKK